MTLQYRIRSKYEDQRWAQRVYLCEAMLSGSIDDWCMSGRELPTDAIAVGIVRLFSPRFDPYTLSPTHVFDWVRSGADNAQNEYALVWPDRKPAEAAELISSLRLLVSRAVDAWSQRGIGDPAVAEVVAAVVTELIARRYVIVHHCQTTSRDANHWGI